VSDESTAQSPPVESQQAAAKAKPQPLPHKKKRLRRKVVAPLVLGVLGLALLLGAFFLYPRRTELPTPPFTELELTTTGQINLIAYNVDAHSNLAKLSIFVWLDPGQSAVPTTLKILLPFDERILDCHAPCEVQRYTGAGGAVVQYQWAGTLAFKLSPDGLLMAEEDFFIQTPHFGEVYNGVNASAAIPEIDYQGPDNPEPPLATQYIIPSASSYDWSSLPTEGTTGPDATWAERLPLGFTPARVAVGINHAAQSDDSTKTFIAGALLGLAGGAILSAFQEALHASDRVQV
jgi:hypothetical protein